MSLVTVGDNVVDRYPQLGYFYPGGNCVNVAVHARRAGYPAAYLGAVGDDHAGRVLRSALEAEQVELSRLRVLQGATATADIELRDGERVFQASEKGVSLFKLDAEDLSYLSGYVVAHSSYCSGLEEQIRDIAAQVPVSYDFADRHDHAYAVPLLEHTQVASFSASDLTDSETEQLVRWAHGLGPRVVLATRGAAGAVLFDGGRLHHQPAIPTTPLDTLGAGDAFIARALVGLQQGEPIDELLAAAAEIAAATCREHGGFGHAALLETPEGSTNRS